MIYLFVNYARLQFVYIMQSSVFLLLINNKLIFIVNKLHRSSWNFYRGNILPVAKTVQLNESVVVILIVLYSDYMMIMAEPFCRSKSIFNQKRVILISF